MTLPHIKKESSSTGSTTARDFFDDIKALNKTAKAILEGNFASLGDEVLNEIYSDKKKQTYETSHPYADYSSIVWEFNDPAEASSH